MTGSELFQAITNLEDAALILLDTEGKIKKWSNGAHKIYGYSEDEALRRPFTSLFPERESSLTAQHLQQLQHLKKLMYEGTQMRKDATLFNTRVTYSAINDDSDLIKGYVVHCADLTEEKIKIEANELFQKRLEEEVSQRTRQLQVANEELEAFSYSVSHDLRAPLRAINGFSQVLIEQYTEKLDAEGIRLLEVVHWNAELMGQLIDDLLKFSRLSKLNVVDASVNMNAVVQKALSMLITPEKTEQYNIEVGPLQQCMGDENMLLQVWINLIDNALKYTSKTTNPRIEIGSSEQSSKITYFIRDNGAGFDMKYADKLFGVFQRLHSHDEFSGTGLGLALIKRIISKHGGEINAKAEVNKGAEFRFHLNIPRHEHTS